MAERVKVLERKVLDARRAGEIVSEDTPGQIDEAERKGVLTATEAVAVRAFDDKVMALTGVDDFDAAELGRTQAGATPTASAPRSVNKKTPRPARKKPSRSVKKKPQRKKAVQQRSETAAED